MEYSIYESVWVSLMCVDAQKSIESDRYANVVFQIDALATGKLMW